ncbi:MAG: RNA 2',3'-cyclic phosphodiesterase [Candidatus Kryptoniota bacterium]
MRIFFGATIPESTKAQIVKVQAELRSSAELIHPEICEARFEAKDKLHITLQFMGDFKPDKSSELFSSVKSEIGRSLFEFSSVEIVGIKFFPSEKIRRGIWLECRDDGALSEIAEAIKSVTNGFGIVPEAREFTAHITIGRLKENRQASCFDLKKFEREGKLQIDKFLPMSVALFESTLKSSGSEYIILSQISLHGA